METSTFHGLGKVNDSSTCDGLAPIPKVGNPMVRVGLDRLLLFFRFLLVPSMSGKTAAASSAPPTAPPGEIQS